MQLYVKNPDLALRVTDGANTRFFRNILDADIAEMNGHDPMH